jgi:diguanylate cyclase (GGDEF)-like protein
MEEIMESFIKESRQSRDQIFFLLMDIDYFKQVNDTYGHDTGDVVLRKVAGVLKNYMNDDCVPGRWGGEEFVIVCYGYDLEQVCAMAEDLRKAVNSEKFADVGSITCSIGITMLTAADTINEAFDRMDKALYRAKDEGRNRVIA